MPQLFDFERVLFDYVIPVDREARELQLATSGAKAARIVFLTSSTIFLSDRAFAPASKCYAGNDSNIVCLRLIRVPRGKFAPATRAIWGKLILERQKFSLAQVRSRCPS
jgi:hypothetical protein